jgi:hypothetical protein
MFEAVVNIYIKISARSEGPGSLCNTRVSEESIMTGLWRARFASGSLLIQVFTVTLMSADPSLRASKCHR